MARTPRSPSSRRKKPSEEWEEDAYEHDEDEVEDDPEADGDWEEDWDDDTEEGSCSRGPLSRAWLYFSAPLVVLIIVWTASAWSAPALALSVPTPVGWALDLLASLAAQGSIVAGLLAIAWLIGRAWVRGWIALLCSGALIGAVWSVPRTEPAAGPVGQRPVVRILAFNALSTNSRPGAAFDLIMRTEADAIAMIEPSDELLDLIRSSEAFRARYPHFRLPDRASSGFRFIISRHPLIRDAAAFGDDWPEFRETTRPHGIPAVVVDAPQGRFVMMAMQSRSPRTPTRWRAGLDQALSAARGATMVDQGLGLPVVVAGDLNGSPTGVRSRMINAIGRLSTTKPTSIPAGTWPALLPGPLRTAIDGAWVSRGVRVVSWGTAGSAGSDHHAVLVELMLPAE